MRFPEMERQRLKEILDNIPKLKIAVIGDFFLDKWLEINRSLDEASVETNLTAYQVTAKRCYAGAAGTVLSNLAALEAGTLYALGFVGDDGEGFELLRILGGMGADTGGLFTSADVMTPTYTKPVFRTADSLEETHRLDHRNIRPMPFDLESKIIDAAWKTAAQADAMIALDQLTHEGCGVLSPRVRQELADIGRQYPSLVLYADSRAFIRHFNDMIIKCNNIEAEKLCGLTDTEQCLLALAGQSRCPVFITCGSKGVMTMGEDGHPVLVPGVSLPPETRIDIVGAGDACTAGIVCALCGGASPREAAFIGNLTAALTIQVIGSTGTADRKQVLELYDKYYG